MMRVSGTKSPHRSAKTLAFLLTMLFIGKAAGDDLAKDNWILHGLDPDARTTLQKHLQDSVEDGSVPGGALLLIQDGEVVFRQGFGHGHVREQQPFTAETPFRVASISKSIIATLVIKLAAENHLQLDESIDVYLPQMKSLRLRSGEALERMPTVAECLKHTAGFASDDEKGGRPWLSLTGKGLILEQVIGREEAIPMSQNPGKKFAYSGIGYDVVGRIIEVVMQKSLDEVLQSELCVPLGIQTMTYYPDIETAEMMPSFYWRWRSDGGLRRRLHDPKVHEGEYASVGGGIVSTVDDLAKLMMLYRNAGVIDGTQLIESTSLERMIERHPPGSYYGLGWTLGPAGEDGLPSWIFHSGSSGTMWWWDRRRDVIGVLATQHHYSNGKPIPESEKKIAVGQPSWQATTKANFIDPIFGWTGYKVGIPR